jgi:hypothetical protein
MKCFAKATFVAILVSAAAVWAQAQMQPSKPGPELKKLDYFAGDWKTEGKMTAEPGMSGGTFNATDHARWLDGGFFLVTHTKFSAPFGSGTEIEIMGYDANTKVYTFDMFNSMGQHEIARGSVNGNTWTWTSELKAGDQTFKSRFVENILSANSYQLRFEMSPDGTNWSTVMEGTATKVTARQNQK